MANCRWQLNSKGEVEGAYTDKGEKSKLFEDFKTKFGVNKAVELYTISQSESFKELYIQEEEPSLESVIRYVAQQNEGINSLSNQQLIELQDFDNVDKQKLIDVFYDKSGLFFTDVNKLVKSGLYSQYEAQTINEDIELQKQIKESLERLKNTQIEEFESILQIRERTSEFNSFGKLKAINPQIVEDKLRQNLVGIKDRNEFDIKLEEIGYLNVDADKLFEDLKSYKKAEVFVEIDGELRQKRVTETELILPLVAKQTTNTKLEELLRFELNFLQRNEQTTFELLQEIEEELINDGIDIRGLSTKIIDKNLMDFLNVLDTFIQSPTKENTSLFASISDIFFERDLTPQIKAVKGDENKEYIFLDTDLTEEQVYEQAGFIKTEKKNIWIKTAKEDLETLYNNLKTYPEKYPKDKTLEEYIQEQITNFEDFTNAENAEAITLYKMYFDVKKEEEENIIETVADFTGDYEYLSNGFVSDFYVEILKGKHKNFGVNEKGIYLINNDGQTVNNIKLVATNNLKQYSLISKQLPNLTVENKIGNRRDDALNNPEKIEKFKGQIFNLNSNEVIVKDNAQEFIKIGNNIFESFEKEGNLNHFVKINKNNTDYKVVNVEAPMSNIIISDYKYLETELDKFVSTKNYLKNENLTHFDC